MTDAQLAELVRRYQLHLHTTSERAGATLADLWDQLGQWDEADVETFATQAAPAVGAAQQHGAALAAAFVALVASIPTPTPGDVTAPNWQQPFNAYWASLANGTPWADAVQVGRNAAETLGFDSVQTAARDTTSQIDKTTPTITAWQRIPDAGACPWCLMVAEQNYHTAESASFGHDRCGCSVVPA